MKDAWRELLGDWDTDGDGEISESELQIGVENAFMEMDLDGDGFIEKEELEAALMARSPDLAPVSQMIKALDTDGDGRVSREELKALVF